MPRRRTASTESRGKQCRRCGADEWHKEGKSGDWRCWPCRLRYSRERCARKDKADPARRLYASARQRAAKQGLPFNLTVDDIRAVWPPDGRCPVLGVELTQGEKVLHDASPTLDRINPKWGYEAGNIAVMSLAANRAKGALRASELTRIADWMRAQGLD